MTRLYGDTIDKLRQEQSVLHSKLEGLARAEIPDSAVLGRLREAAWGCKQESHSLLVTMLFEDASPALTDAADELLDAFNEAVDRADALLARIQRKN